MSTESQATAGLRTETEPPTTEPSNMSKKSEKKLTEEAERARWQERRFRVWKVDQMTRTVEDMVEVRLDAGVYPSQSCTVWLKESEIPQIGDLVRIGLIPEEA